MSYELKQKYCTACLEGDIDTVLYMINYENASLKKYELMYKCIKNSCRGGHYDIFIILLDYKDITQAMSSKRLSKLLRCSYVGNNTNIITKVIEIFTNSASDFSETTMWYCRLLGTAESGNLELFNTYVNDAILEDLYYININTFRNCLVGAIKKGKNIRLVEYILNEITKFKGSTSEIIGFYIKESLKFASSVGNLEIVNLIINQTCVNWETNDYTNAVVSACSKGHIDVVKFMVEKVEKIENVPKYFNTAMCQADYENHGDYVKYVEIVKLFEDKGAIDFRTCVINACLRGRLDIFKFMIKKICEMREMKGIYGAEFNTFLHYACNGYLQAKPNSNADHPEIIKILTQQRAINLITCLSYACCVGDYELAKNSIEYGARDWDEGLKYACKGGHIKLVELMLENGAIDIERGMEYATVYSENVDVMHLLVNKGATNLEPLMCIYNFRLFCMYCSMNNAKPTKKVYLKLLQKYPPYVLLIGSKANIKHRKISQISQISHIKRLPVELLRIIFNYLV